MSIWQALALRMLLLGCFGLASMATSVEIQPKAHLMRKSAFDDESGAQSKRLLRKDALQTSIELDDHETAHKLTGTNENRYNAVVMTTYNPTYDDPNYDPSTDPNSNPSSAGSSDGSSTDSTGDGNTGSRSGVMDGQSGDSDSDNAGNPVVASVPAPAHNHNEISKHVGHAKSNEMGSANSATSGAGKTVNSNGARNQAHNEGGTNSANGGYSNSVNADGTNAHNQAHDNAHSQAHNQAHSVAHSAGGINGATGGSSSTNAHNQAHNDAHSQAHNQARSAAHSEGVTNGATGGSNGAHANENVDSATTTTTTNVQVCELTFSLTNIDFAKVSVSATIKTAIETKIKEGVLAECPSDNTQGDITVTLDTGATLLEQPVNSGSGVSTLADVQVAPASGSATSLKSTLDATQTDLENQVKTKVKTVANLDTVKGDAQSDITVTLTTSAVVDPVSGTATTAGPDQLQHIVSVEDSNSDSHTDRSSFSSNRSKSDSNAFNSTNDTSIVVNGPDRRRGTFVQNGARVTTRKW